MLKPELLSIIQSKTIAKKRQNPKKIEINPKEIVTRDAHSNFTYANKLIMIWQIYLYSNRSRRIFARNVTNILDSLSIMS